MDTGSWHRNTLSISAIAAFLVFAILSTPAQAAERGFPASATGSGHTIVAGELRTFSFAAQASVDGSTSGVAQVNNRAIGEMFELRLDCLRTFDNTAIISGVFTRHTDSNALGLTGIFAVVDSGEGAGSEADLITQVFFFLPGTLTCADLVPADAIPFLVPLEAGNVQLH